MAQTILILDDEPAARERFEGILRGAGYATTHAQDLASALIGMTVGPPDLILLDLRTPGISALEACARLKGDPATERVPIIMVMPLKDVAHKAAVLIRGADDFLTMPIDSDDLLARVEALLNVRHIREKLARRAAYLHELETARDARRPAPRIPRSAASSEAPSNTDCRPLISDL